MTNRLLPLAAITAALFVLLAPTVTWAGVTVPAEPASATLVALEVAGYLLAAALIVSRALPVLRPIVQRLPADWRWLPGAIGAAALPLQALLPDATTLQDVVLAVLAAVGAYLVARDAGALPPDHDDPTRLDEGDLP